jgi:hypothetical protein
MYLAILDAARSPADLAAYLDGELLADLHLARAVRAPWEARFKELRPAAATATLRRSPRRPGGARG